MEIGPEITLMLRRLFDRFRPPRDAERMETLRAAALKAAEVGHLEAEASRRRRAALNIELATIRRGTK